jgi:DNA-binding CsgD family transcriptional regulator
MAACETHEGRFRFHERRMKLTPCEREVMDLLAHGNDTKRIATMLGINGKTVFVHRAGKDGR